MYLKKLELNGFKTFPDKTVIEFTQARGIAAIVGPNGCGKSNIIDAFRWVMGEQSIRQLRGTTQEEVIFAGTESRKALSMAEVTLTIDNSDKQLPVDFVEVQISRRYYRSGESEYLLNKQRVRLKDVQELLMDTGIGKGSYSIIGQGQVVELLHSKPEDRRTLFEEAAGINKYKVRKTEAERKLARAEQNLTRLEDIRSEIHQQLGPLEEQARVAQEYQVLKKDLSKLEIGLFKEKIGKVDVYKKEIEQAIAILREAVTVADQQADSLQKHKEEFREKIVAIEAQIESIAGQLKSAQGNRGELRNKLNVAEERRRNQDQRIESLEKEIAQLADSKRNMLQSIESAEVELQGSIKSVEEFEARLTRKSEESKGIFDKWQELAQEIQKSKSNLSEHEELVENKKSKLMGLESTEKVINSDIQRIAVSISTMEVDQQELLQREQELVARKSTLAANVTELKEKRETLFKQKSQNEEDRKGLINKRYEVKELFDTRSSRLTLLEEMQKSHEGFQKGVRSVFETKQQQKTEFLSVRNILADSLNVPKEYEGAIEAALGSNVQAIVVDGQADIAQMIGYLAQHALGKATFIANSKTGAVPKQSPLGKTASSVVSCDEAVRPIVDVLLGDCIIVDSLQVALANQAALAEQGLTAFVTLAGEVVTTKGLITGGVVGNKDSISLLGRQREVIELKQEITQYQKELAEMDLRIKELEENMQKVEQELKEHGKNLHALEIEQGAVANDVARASIDKEKYARLLKTNITDKGDRDNELQRINAEKQRVNQELSELLDQKESLNKEIDALAAKADEASRDKEKASELLTEIKIGATNAQATRKQIELKISSFRDSLQNTERQLTQKQDEKQNILQQKEQAAVELDVAKEELPEMEARIIELEQKVAGFNTERSRYFNDLQVYDRKEKEQSSSDREIRQKLSEEEIKLARIDAEEQEIGRRLNSEYGLTVNDVLASQESVEDYDKAQAEVDKLKRSIKRMEPVNLLAIEEYDAQKERLAFIEDQCEDLGKSCKDLVAIIKELDKAAIIAFKETFDIVNEHFKDIFVRLFKGGYGELKILDPENILNSGVEIYARVPGAKKVQSMMLLSGGQKALTAIALLFSLMSAKPGPFCILDEIDAALDDANIGRVTDVLQEYSKNTQIIVITHRQPTMSIVNTMFGLTMEQKGISKVVSVNLKNHAKEAIAVGG